MRSTAPFRVSLDHIRFLRLQNDHTVNPCFVVKGALDNPLVAGCYGPTKNNTTISSPEDLLHDQPSDSVRIGKYGQLCYRGTELSPAIGNSVVTISIWLSLEEKYLVTPTLDRCL
jgi:hypothetical protein